MIPIKFRHELKHRINNFDIVLLRKKLLAIAEYDKHCRKNGFYHIRSLYLDNYNDKALREKLHGLNKREKFRIRFYNNDPSFIRLEKKSKVNGLCSKQSAVISKEQCQKIIDNDISFLIKSDNELLQELYAKMNFQLLRPRCIVAYERECFVYKAGNVRVTLDQDIRGSYNVKSFLEPDVCMTQLFHTSILEVKWDAYLPKIIRDIIQIKSRRSSSFSKYAAVRF